jgi:hypothetical protein
MGVDRIGEFGDQASEGQADRVYRAGSQIYIFQALLIT